MKSIIPKIHRPLVPEAWIGLAEISWRRTMSQLLYRCVDGVRIGNAGNAMAVARARIEQSAAVTADAVLDTAFAR